MKAIQAHSVLILLTVLQSVLGRGPNRKNELNLSKVEPAPIAFWPIQSSKHNVPTPTEKRLAFLQNVSLSYGPTLNFGVLNALEFLEGSESFTFISNNEGILNGERAMCWMLFVYIPTSAMSQSSTLLSYQGINNHPGFTLGVSFNGQLAADFHDIDGSHFRLNSSIALEPSKWQFIGINFNMLWEDNQFDFFLIDYATTEPNVIKDTHSLSSANLLRLNAHGAIFLGMNQEYKNHFIGKLACLQFYNTSIIGGTQRDAVKLCDPNMWLDPDYGDYTLDLDSSIETVEAAHTQLSTSSTTTTTQLATTKTHRKATTQVSVTKTQPTFTTQQTFTQPEEYPTEKICTCMYQQINKEELADKIESFKSTLRVNKETTSMTMRKKSCAEDRRASAQVIGQCGLTVLIIIAALLVLPDILITAQTLINILRKTFHTFNPVQVASQDTTRSNP